MVDNAPLTESEAAAANNELENFALIDEIEEATKDVPDDESPKPLNPDEERQPEDTSLIDQLLSEEVNKIEDHDVLEEGIAQSEYVPAVQ